MKINNIYNIDVFKFLNLLDDNSLDLAIIDPPYNLNKAKWDEFDNENEYFKFTFKWIDKLIPKLKKNASIYIFNTPKNSAHILNYLSNCKNIYFQNWITWYKKDGFSYSKKKYVSNQETILFFSKNNKDITFNFNDIRVPYSSLSRISHAKNKGILKNGKRWYPNENGKLCSDVWEFSSDRHNKKINGRVMKSFHPTPKPEKLIERIVKASSNEKDLVLDLFSGTGTTSYICKKFNRNYIGCEIDNEYYKISIERLDNLGVLDNEK